jgi:LytR cell envelope-related transcriptional attenuator
LALVIAGFAGAISGGHLGQNSGTAPIASTTSSSNTTTTTTTITRLSVKVQVANGTHQNGVAVHLTQVLQAQGWSMSTPANTNSPVLTTTVYYAPTMQRAAILIGGELGVSPSAVQPLTVGTPVAAVSGIDVLVVVGPDLASRAGTLTPPT